MGIRDREEQERKSRRDLVPGNTRNNNGSSAFVTDGALLGIKPVRRDAEHVVALDAHAVDDRTDDGAGPGRFS
jgi:hypothetical protein